MSYNMKLRAFSLPFSKRKNKSEFFWEVKSFSYDVLKNKYVEEINSFSFYSNVQQPNQKSETS